MGRRCRGTRSRGSPIAYWRRWRPGRRGRWTRSTRSCSSTRSGSRSGTARSPTGPSTPSSASTWTGERDILGLWAGDGSEGAKYWQQVLSEILNRGVVDVCIVVCDGLKGLPDAINAVWPQAIVQTCVLHLIRNTFRYASKAVWDEMARDLRPVYTAATEQAARIALLAAQKPS